MEEIFKGENMSRSKLLPIALGALMVACSQYKYVSLSGGGESDTDAYRSVANSEEAKTADAQKEKIQFWTETIFQSHLYGQELLHRFDQKLEENPETALDSQEYNELLAIRTIADHSEHEVVDLYVDLVKTATDEKSSQSQKQFAEENLSKISEFFDGQRSNGKGIPENLQPVILGNIWDLHQEVSADLKKWEAKSDFKTNSILARSARKSFQKNMSQYALDIGTFQKTLNSEAEEKSFQAFRNHIKEAGKEIKKLRTEVKTGRSTSSNVFYPSTGSAGNITGNGFPRNTWALTFDDGPNGGTSLEVLNNLKRKGLIASFFVLAKQAAAYPAVIKSFVDSGMEIASHSYTHPQLTKLGAAGLQKEIVQSKGVIESKSGTTVTNFRLPYGAGVSRSNIRSLIASQKMLHVFWNVDTLDWQDKNPQSIFNRAVKQMSATKNNAGVILFHDIHRQTVTASALVMDHLKSTGAKVCTVEGIVNQINKDLSSCR